jgi:hypothetical protein
MPGEGGPLMIAQLGTPLKPLRKRELVVVEFVTYFKLKTWIQ